MEGIELIITGSSGPVALGKSYNLSIQRIPANATDNIVCVWYYAKTAKGSEYESIEMVDEGDYNFSYDYMARSPGVHLLMAEAIIGGVNKGIESSPIPVTHRFPNREEVHAALAGKINDLWTTSKDAATDTHTYEFAALMYINTLGSVLKSMLV